jgi:hypothetical protein
MTATSWGEDAFVAAVLLAALKHFPARAVPAVV